MSWDEAMMGAQVAARAAAPSAMDSAQFTAFYERSARPLWAFLLRCSGDPALAEDLMQEAYVRFLGATQPTDGEVAARRYLFRIASNLLRDHWRRPAMRSLDEMPEGAFATPDGTDELHACYELARAMEKMKPRDRQLLWLAHAENYTHAEIAEIMGMGTTSVKIMLFRARGRVRQVLEGSR